MPTVGNSLASKLWNIKARSPSSIDNTSLFSEGYEDAHEAHSELGPHLIIFIVTGFFAALFVAGIVTSRVVARQQAKKHPRMLVVEESADVKGIEQRMAAFLARPEPLSLNLEAKTAKAATVRPLVVAPALHSSKPKYGNSKTTLALEAESESDNNEALAVPAVTVDLLEEGLSTSLSGVSIIPWTLLEGICADKSELKATDGTENVKADSSSSFYSDEMLEEMSSIAADLKGLSLGKSMDLEVKSVDSERSSARLVEPEYEQQPLECTVESGEVCQPAVNAAETLEDIILQIEGMIDWTGIDESRVHSETALSSRACSTSTLAFGSPKITIEEDTEDPSGQKNGNEKFAGMKKSEKLFVIPLAECSPSTTFDNDITLVTSPATDKGKSVSPLTSFVSGLELVLVADDSANYPGSAFLFPPRTPRSGIIHDELATVESGSPQAASDSETTAGDIPRPEPSLARAVLSTVKNGVRSGGVSQPSRPARRNHTRTSSQGLAENHSGTAS